MKLSGKWEMIWKNPDSFETVQKMGNYLEKSGQFISFFLLYVQKISGRTKKILGSKAQRRKNLGGRVALLPGKFLRVRKVFARITEKTF